MAIIKKFRIKSFKKDKPLIKLDKISLSFSKRRILENINFNINKGEILGMLGPNGVGKSTIFNLITGLLKPDYGSIIIDNENVLDYPISERTTRFKIGYVPQYGGYFHDLTLMENLKAVGEVLIKDKQKRSTKIDELISKFELDPVINIQAKFLSGGQKKKLVIALALIGDPKVLLLDECFAALDVLTIKMLQELIVNLQTQNNISICICDHQARDLLSCVDVAIVLSNCKIIAKGTPSELTRWPSCNIPFNCCVAQPVTKDEVLKMNNERINDPMNKKRDPMFKYEGSAQHAIDKEWKRLKDLGTWDATKPMEYDDVVTNANKTGKTVQFGNVFNLFVLKGSELLVGDPNRKYKGRTVFQGNRVWDQNWEIAMFQELSSSPATMESSKAADLAGMTPGYTTKQCDATQAYSQAKLGGDETWVLIPEDQWEPGWKEAGYKRPCCRLILALYGHPNSGAYWEQHCDEHLRNICWTPIDDNDAWRSCYWHKEKKAFLVVYVDDFKLSSKECDHDALWEQIRHPHKNPVTGVETVGLELEAVHELGHFLGCKHVRGRGKSPITGKECNTMTYEMRDFMLQCVDKYCLLANKPRSSLKAVPTPFVEAGSEKGERNACTRTCTGCHAVCVSGNRATETAGGDSSEGSASELNSENEQDYGGKLRPIASRILMKVLYGARMARPDLLKAVGKLATRVTKWTPHNDAELHRLMCYINSTLDYALVGWCNDELKDLELVLYADADFANESDSKSTNGVFFEVYGPDTRFMLAAVSKKQSCVSHSTPEAEIVAADFALRTVGLPSLILWDRILEREAKVKFYEDNETMIVVCKTGKNPTMRHLQRTHRVSISWLYERFKERWHDLVYIMTDFQCADIFTKAFVDKAKWDANLKLIHVVNTKSPTCWEKDEHWMKDPTVKKVKQKKKMHHHRQKRPVK